MIFAILFGTLAAIAGALFWVFIVMLIVKAVQKRPKKSAAVGSGVCGGLWLIFTVCALIFGVKALSGGTPLARKMLEGLGTAGANIGVTSVESVKKGWNKVLLRKIDKLAVSFVSLREISEDERDVFDFADTNGKKIFEIILSVQNPLDASEKIPYRKISKEQLIFGRDVNGNYLPVFIIDDTGLSTVPWILTFLLPAYRKNSASQYVPAGKSELRLRIDAADSASIEKIILGSTEIAVPHTEPTEKLPPQSA